MSRTTKPAPLTDAMLEEAASTLRVLAHPHRLRLIDLLLAEEHSVGELAEATELAPNAVSQHLNHMKAHGLLDVRRHGRTAFYFIVNPHASHVIDCIRRHGTGRPDRANGRPAPVGPPSRRGGRARAAARRT